MHTVIPPPPATIHVLGSAGPWKGYTIAWWPAAARTRDTRHASCLIRSTHVPCHGPSYLVPRIQTTVGRHLTQTHTVHCGKLVLKKYFPKLIPQLEIPHVGCRGGMARRKHCCALRIKFPYLQPIRASLMENQGKGEYIINLGFCRARHQFLTYPNRK